MSCTKDLKDTHVTVLALCIAIVAPQPQAQAVSWGKVTFLFAAIAAGVYWWLSPNLDGLATKVQENNRKADRLNNITREDGFWGTEASLSTIASNARRIAGSVEKCKQQCVETISDMRSMQAEINICYLRWQHRQTFDREIHGIKQALGMQCSFESDIRHSGLGQAVVGFCGEGVAQVSLQATNVRIAALEKTVLKLDKIIEPERKRFSDREKRVQSVRSARNR